MRSTIEKITSSFSSEEKSVVHFIVRRMAGLIVVRLWPECFNLLVNNFAYLMTAFCKFGVQATAGEGGGAKYKLPTRQRESSGFPKSEAVF